MVCIDPVMRQQNALRTPRQPLHRKTDRGVRRSNIVIVVVPDQNGDAAVVARCLEKDPARRFPDVESVALHPATFMDTKMVRSRVGTPSNTVQTGADATVRLASDFALEVQGRYFDVQREARPDALAYDADARKRLWDVSEQLIA